MTTIPRCQHVKVNGTQCGSPALRSQRFCYFHSRQQLNPAGDSLFDFPVLEDANAIQIALMQVIRAIADNKIDSKRAGLLLYALQTASYNLKRTSLDPGLDDVVRDTSALAQEVTPPPDPVDLIRAMRRSYWKLRDPGLLDRDREIVARECAPRTPPTPIPPPHPPKTPNSQLSTQSPAHPITTSPDSVPEPRDELLSFVHQITAKPPLPTQNSQLATQSPAHPIAGSPDALPLTTRQRGLATTSP